MTPMTSEAPARDSGVDERGGGRRARIRSRICGQQGVVTTFLVSVLAAGGALSLAGVQGITASSQYNRCRQIVIDLAANPNSHSQTEADSCGDSLLGVIKTAINPCFTDSPGCTNLDFPEARAFDPTGFGVTRLVAAVESQEDVRSQPVVFQFSVDPPRPLAHVDVTVTVRVLNPATNRPVPAGTRVAFDFRSTDGFAESGVVLTDADGTHQFIVEGALAVGVRDTFTFTVGSVTRSFSYTYH